MINDLLKSIPVINFDGQVQITVCADDFELQQLLSTPAITDATESDASMIPMQANCRERWKQPTTQNTAPQQSFHTL